MVEYPGGGQPAEKDYWCMIPAFRYFQTIVGRRAFQFYMKTRRQAEPQRKVDSSSGEGKTFPKVK